jgi:hypothetical protein
MKAHWEKRDKINRRLRYATYAVAIGVGIGAMALTGGTAGSGLSLMSVPLRTWLVGGGMIAETGMTARLYADSRDTARVAQDLYLATKSSASRADMVDAIEMKEGDFRLLVGSLVGLGISSVPLLKVATNRIVTSRGGQAFVKITREEITELRVAVRKVAGRAEALTPLGRALLAVARRGLGLALTEKRMVRLGDAIASTARKLKLAPSIVAQRVEDAPWIGRLIKGWKARELSSQIIIEEALVKKAAGLPAVAPSSFTYRMVTNQLREATITTVAQYLADGDEIFGDKKGELIENIVRSSMISTVLTFTGQKVLPQSKTLNAKAQRANIALDNTLPAPIPIGPVASFARDAAKNAAWGLVINGTIGGVKQSYQHLASDDPHGPTLSERFETLGRSAGWSALTLGLSSTTRYRIFQHWVEPFIAGQVQNKPLAKILIQSAWTANDLFGGWSYVLAGRAVGALDHDGKEIDETSPEDSWSVQKLRVADLQPAYLKIAPEEEAGAEYLFDFLREGADAGPVPVALQ